ncbi:unnamed protein product [Callosobruchus maculatus]|uniref:Uncharacterized protein n=1 Tax=Callosobruchus maculatus TaxID=64391 RepID=A0A653CH79_CALMS|nr:unnamed protein product [Callosobruchus maculatus]
MGLNLVQSRVWLSNNGSFKLYSESGEQVRWDRKVMREQDERDANLPENVEHKNLLETANAAD